MTKSAVATNEAVAEDDRAPILIDPKRVMVDMEGFLTRRVIIHAPTECIADDLRSPEIWRRVQADRTACLRKDDALSIRAFDDSWRVDAEVVTAFDDSALLDILKVRSRKAATSVVYSDDRHRVEYEGGSWWVIDISTGSRVGHGFGNNKAAAINYAQSLTPRKVA